MYTIVKKIQFCYGHRLQGHPGKCAHPHGHNATAEIELASSELDELGMVCDFSDVTDALIDFVDGELDHRMILRADDPLVAALRGVGEDPYLMDVNPTAENLARLLFERARQKGLPVTAVRLWETDQAYAEFRPDR